MLVSRNVGADSLKPPVAESFRVPLPWIQALPFEGHSSVAGGTRLVGRKQGLVLAVATLAFS